MCGFLYIQDKKSALFLNGTRLIGNFYLASNKILKDSLLKVFRIALAKRGADEMTLILSICFSEGREIVSKTTISLMLDFSSRSMAGPEKTGWVQEA